METTSNLYKVIGQNYVTTKPISIIDGYWRIFSTTKNGDKFKSIDMHGDNRHLRRDVQASTHKQVRTRYGYDTSLQYWYLYIPCQINAKDNMHVLI